MDRSYSLYYTLNRDIPKKGMTKTQENKLKEKLDATDANSQRAIIMLMAEHSKVVDQVSFDVQDITLPYGSVQQDKDFVFDLENIPRELKWILWKFVNLSSGGDETL
jgi:hypothetical protein